MSTKHTPGPWLRNVRSQGRYPVIYAGRNTHVAVAQQMATPDETEANIDLIAAAPEILEALMELERIVSAHPSFQNEWTHAASVIGSARAAIVKATGGAS